MAFICNVCFMFSLGILSLKHPVDSNPGISSLIIVMGFFLSIVLNIVVNAWLFFLLVAKKPAAGIPRFLIYSNGGFLAIQLILLIK